MNSNTKVMEENQHANSGQLNPGAQDQSGNEVTIKKNEGISDQGNEWSDKEEISDKRTILGEKAEKYIRDSADIEDLPEESDEKEKDKVMGGERQGDKIGDDRF